MTFRVLPLLALLALPASAHEPWLVGLGANFQESNSFTTSGPMGAAQVNRRSKIAPSLLVGYKAWHYESFDVALNAEYQFRTTYGGTLSGSGAFQNAVDMSYEKEVFAPGLEWNYHMTPYLDLGLGAQVRFTRLRNHSAGVYTNLDRPWVEAHARYTMPDLGGVKPFAGFRVARALATTPSQPSAQALASRTKDAFQASMQRLESQWDASFQTGVRF
jgi:hypothetical protein